jgi:hypothetical protein
MEGRLEKVKVVLDATQILTDPHSFSAFQQKFVGPTGSGSGNGSKAEVGVSSDTITASGIIEGHLAKRYTVKPVQRPAEIDIEAIDFFMVEHRFPYCLQFLRIGETFMETSWLMAMKQTFW